MRAYKETSKLRERKLSFNNKFEKTYQDMLVNNLKNHNLENKLTCSTVSYKR